MLQRLIFKARVRMAVMKLRWKKRPYLKQGYSSEMASFLAVNGGDVADAREMVEKLRSVRR